MARGARRRSARPLEFRTLVCLYLGLVLIPYALGQFSNGVGFRNWYTESVTILTLAGMTVLLAQFALAGRFAAVNRIAGVDQGLRLHRKVGEWLALLFLLHPLLIVAPRLLQAGRFAPADLWLAFTAPLTASGFYAWALLIVWVLMAMFRDRIGISYESWRLSHGFGAISIAILATDHAVKVGRHGALTPWYNWFWIGTCALAVASLAYSYFIRPLARRRRPFRVVGCERAGRSDWCLTLEQDGEFSFPFTAGQFVWLNSTGNAFSLAEHPFSIASCPARSPRLSFIIRELGDYTRSLGKLAAGQRIYLDGPFGEFTLSGRSGRGIALIAGGAGIGPILGLLRELSDRRDQRPIRLVYGNRTLDQMVAQGEIAALTQELDLVQTLAVSSPSDGFEGHVGFIDRQLLAGIFGDPASPDWDYFICGSPVMVRAVVANLRALQVPANRLVYEQLGF